VLASVVPLSWTACRTVLSNPPIPPCPVLDQYARDDIQRQCSRDHNVFALCPNLEVYLGDIQTHCEEIDALAGRE
jgi:hypothetical protein